ncbi:recombinase family protein [Candidatus Eisenbacteria bacterium]|uniref:Recombinase family protein n=1 Tax=Eiseniibacteriota bacterium TaxID=2212470 RepID=A0ABV6YKQ9_UNCEI
MLTKIRTCHLEKPAYVYLRQSTMGQVRHHRESTERQYALRDKAENLGWRTDMIRILDGDLGLSGTRTDQREDFKTLVADVSMNKVGAVFSLEASRLSRSNTDWHRLLELCSLTKTLILDEDGCYDPSDFNDQLLLGLKGTMSQAELHFMRARLLGGKLNKARKGELRCPLPVGYVYDEAGKTIIDPDLEVQGAIRRVFDAFREVGSAYGVVHLFGRNQLRFPKRAYGGAWDGNLVWGNLVHARVRDVLRNPEYSGAYTYGRYSYEKTIDKDGQIRSKIISKPMDQWEVLIKDHHEGYVTWEEYLENRRVLAKNRTNAKGCLLPGPAREGLALLQGLLICADCGRKIYIRYTGNGGIYPCYQCTWRKRDGLSHKHCISIPCRVLDKAVSARVVEVLQPSQINIAVRAFEELERRTGAINRQWQLRIQRAEYEVQLAQRRYEEVDPSNRLVASTLEKRWNDGLLSLEEVRKQYEEHRKTTGLSDIARRKSEVLSLGKDLPRLWQAKTTKDKDRKRILRLLLKDVTVKREARERRVLLQLRWQGGATEEIAVDLPPRTADKWRHSPEIVERVRAMTKKMTDLQIAETFNGEGLRTSKGNAYTRASVSWIRYKHSIPAPNLKEPNEMTVRELAVKFNISPHVVYYWIERKVVEARRLNRGSPWWIKLDTQTEKTLQRWIEESPRIVKTRQSQSFIAGGAL